MGKLSDKAEEFLDRMKWSRAYSDEQLQLSHDDLESGISISRVSQYMKPEYDIFKMRLISKALHMQLADEMIDSICALEVTAFELNQIVDACIHGATIDQAIEQIQYVKEVHEIKAGYEVLCEKVDKIMGLIEHQQNEELQHQKELAEDLLQNVQFQEEQLKKLQAENLQYKADKEKWQEKSLQYKADKEKWRSEIADLKKDKEKLNDELIKVRSGDGELFSLAENKIQPLEAHVQKPLPAVIEPVHRILEQQPQTIFTFGTAPDKDRSRTLKRMVGIFAGFLGFQGGKRESIIKRVINRELSSGQLEQMKFAMQKKLTTRQMEELINNKLAPEQMREIIEIAALENEIGQKEV